MPSKTRKLKRSARTGRFALASVQGSAIRVVSHGKTPSGDEVWRVSANGRSYKLTTSSSSVDVMDDAVRIYQNALERLAKR